MSIKGKIESLISAGNTTTGEADTDLTSVIQSLVDGYGQGGGEIHNQDKTVVPSELVQSITADAGYTGLGEVTVDGIPTNYVGSAVPRKSSADLTDSGATVNVPSGYYSASASKSVKNGTEGTPTVTKGTVANHSVDITPSVTNVEGYIQGGTKNGSAVKVSASELVSGTLEIDSSGTKDVTNYKNVSVPSGSEGTPVATKGAVSNHAVDVTPSVTNTEGYIAGGTKSGTAVSVQASELVSGTKSISITQNGTTTEDVTNYADAEITVNVPQPSGTKSVSITSNGTSTEDVTSYASASINVNVPNSYSESDEGKVVSSGALVSQTSATYTENDTYDTTLINEVTVNVSGGGGDEIVDVIEGTITSIDNSEATSVGQAVFNGWTSLQTVNLPNITTIGSSAFASCTNLRSVTFLNCVTVNTNAFQNCTNANFKTVVLPKCTNLKNTVFRYDSYLKTLDMLGGAIEQNPLLNTRDFDTWIIRKTDDIVPLPSITNFSSNKFAENSTGGTLYVPSALISSYQSATNWSTILGYTNNQIKSIESTHTDPNAPIDLTLYYADGTPIT